MVRTASRVSGCTLFFLSVFASMTLAYFVWSGFLVAKATQEVEERYSISHAVPKHQQDAIQARSCLEKFGPDVIYSPLGNDARRIKLCLIPPGEPGKKGTAIQVWEKILGQWKELTGFIDESITTEDALISWAEQDMGKYGWWAYAKESIKQAFPFLVVAGSSQILH